MTRAAAVGVLVVGFAASAAAGQRAGERRGLSSVPKSADGAAAVAIQPDGRTVVAGWSGPADGSASDFAVARFLRDGRLDRTFGAGGKTLTGFDVLTGFGTGNYAAASSVAIQRDREIVAAGSHFPADAVWPDFALARYRRDGSLDPRFGTAGRLLGGFRDGADASSVAIQADGRIVIGGESEGGFTLVRYLPDGRLDRSFGANGIVLTSFGAPRDAGIESLALQADGKIVVAGWWNAPPSLVGAALVRYLPDGSVDPSFGSRGRVPLDFGVGAVAIQPDGKIVVAGVGKADFALARFLPSGTLDPTFGAGGEVFTEVGQASAASALAVEPDGKIVVAGSALPIGNQPASEIALARYLADGSLDPSFGSGGKVQTAFGSRITYASSVALAPDGTIAVAGVARAPATGTNAVSDFALVRYRSDGSLDTGFGDGGRVVTDFTPSTWVASLSATRAKRGVRLRWRTLAEADTRGFYVYRQTRHGRVRLNTRLIAGKGTIDRGASYALVDRHAPCTGPPLLAAGGQVRRDAQALRTGRRSPVTGGGVIAGEAVTAGVLVGVLSTAAAPARTGRAVATHDADAAAVAIQSNRRIVVVGTNAEAQKPIDFALVRYLPLSRVDRSFGIAGCLPEGRLDPRKATPPRRTVHSEPPAGYSAAKVTVRPLGDHASLINGEGPISCLITAA
jgi:uncharacterized delta-60 repeat protein